MRHAEVQAGLEGIEIALERYALGIDPEVAVWAWQITEDLERLITIMRWTADYAAMSELAPALIGELHGAYLRMPHQRPEILVGLMRAYASAMWTAKRLGDRRLPSLAAHAGQRWAPYVTVREIRGMTVTFCGCATERNFSPKLRAPAPPQQIHTPSPWGRRG